MPTKRLNPLKQLRLNMNLSQAAVAEASHMTPGAVVKYEQGLYENISCNLLDCLISYAANMGLAVDRNALEYEYAQWREYQRQWNVDRMPSGLWGFIYHPGASPMKQYRLSMLDENSKPGNITKQGLCVMLCIHPSVYSKYEAGDCREMPGMIEDALSSAGVSKGQIAIIQRFGGLYYDQKHGETKTAS